MCDYLKLITTFAKNIDYEKDNTNATDSVHFGVRLL